MSITKATPRRTRATDSRGRPIRGLYVRSDGVYVAGTTISGKWTMQVLQGAKTLNEARAAQRALLEKLDRGEAVAPTRMTLQNVWEEFSRSFEADVAAGNRSIRTHELYRQRWASHIEKRLGRTPVQGIRAADVLSLLAALRKEGLAPWTVKGVYTLLGSVLSHAMTQSYIAESPMRRIEKKKRPQARNKQTVRILSGEEVPRLIAGAWPSWRTFVMTAVYSGARVSEILGLRWSDFDSAAGKLSIERQLGRDGKVAPLKTEGSTRVIELAPVLVKALREHRIGSKHSQEGDFVFATSCGKPHTYANARRAFNAAVGRAKLTEGEGRLSLHSLRHGAASALIASGANVVVVSRFLGHAKASTTLDIYAKQFEEKDQENSGTGEALTKAFGG